MTDRLMDWLTDWLYDWLIECTIDWLIDWLIQWSNIDWFAFYLTVDAGTKFTKEPYNRTVYGTEGSNVTFHWRIAFGKIEDWQDLDDISWGLIYKSYEDIGQPYVTVFKDGRTDKNTQLKPPLLSRVNATLSNCSQSGCDMMFVIQNLAKSDQTKTYGCVATFNGFDKIKSDPVSLVTPGNS